VLFFVGLIIGEALMGILIAIPIVLFESADVLALPERWQFGELLGLAILALVAYVLYRNAVASAKEISEQR